MTNKDIFKIWAPQNIKWSAWVRPVPFISINSSLKVQEAYDFTIPKIMYINKFCLDTAIIIDISGYESIKEGIALAKIGYRPIPIYNGTDPQDGAMATTNNESIEFGLVWGALELKKIELSNDAPPAFLLDTNRLNQYKMNESIFDNSWDIYNQDMPSVEYFLENGITKLIVRGEKIQKDLSKILYKYQLKGIKIFFTSGLEEPKQVKIKKPHLKKSEEL